MVDSIGVSDIFWLVACWMRVEGVFVVLWCEPGELESQGVQVGAKFFGALGAEGSYIFVEGGFPLPSYVTKRACVVVVGQSFLLYASLKALRKSVMMG